MCVIFKKFRIIFHCAAVCHTAGPAGLPGPARVRLHWTGLHKSFVRASALGLPVSAPACPTHSLAFSSRVRHLGRLLSSLIFLVKLKQIKILNECRGRWGRGWGPPSRRGCKWYPQPPIQVRKLVQISSANTPLWKKTGLRPSWFLCCCSALGRRSRPAWQLSYEADKSKVKQKSQKIRENARA